MENTNNTDALLDKAKRDLVADMESRGIGAILWNNATAGFPYIPEVFHRSHKDKDENQVTHIMGMYNFEGTLYLIEEDRTKIKFDDFWNHDTEAPPTVVTLSEDEAVKDNGDPKLTKGFTTLATLEEWTAVADCYFQALNQD